MDRPRDALGRFVSYKRPRDPLTAAAVVVPSGQIEDMLRTGDEWQYGAWDLWRIVGVLHYPTSFMAEQVGRVRWDVHKDGEPLDEDESDEVMRTVTEPQPPSEMSRRIALNLEVAGELFYVHDREKGWSTVAATADKRTEKLKGKDVVVHSWMADPVDPDKADSPVRASLGIVEEIRVIEALSRAQTRNRLAQRGILFYPSEGIFPDGDDFEDQFQQVMLASIDNEYASSAVVPPTVKFPGDLIEKWRHLVLEAPYDDKLQERLDNAIRRLALALNIVPEVLLGLADVNRWNAWISEESTYRAHVEPLAVLTGQTYALALRETLNDQTIEVFPDPSELLARRSSVADAFEALRMGAVGYEYVRRAMGADDEDKPTPEELKLIVLLTAGPQAVAELEGRPTATPERTPVTPPPVDEEEPEAVAAAVDPSDRALDGLARALVDLDIRLLGFLQGAAETAIERARSDLASANGNGSTNPRLVVEPEIARLGKAWNRQLKAARATLRKLGLDARGPEWDRARQDSVNLLEEGLAAFLERTAPLTDSDMPAVPTELLREAIAVAGGS